MISFPPIRNFPPIFFHSNYISKFQYLLDSNNMKRQLTNQTLGKVYRQFSRQRYNKYKHQFPKMRQSQLVLKIIKQWQIMNTPQKQNLSDRYHSSNYVQDQDQQSCKSTGQKPTSHKVDTIISYTPNSKGQNILNTYPPLFPDKKEEDGDSQFNRQSQKYSQQARSEGSSSFQIIVDKTNNSPTSFCKQAQYIKFYKYNYSRLAQEHKSWDAAKICQIIRLKWHKWQKDQKEKLQIKNKIQSKHKRIQKKILSGKKYFYNRKFHEGLTYHQRKQAWRKITLQSRKQYERRGKGISDFTGRLNHAKIMKLQRKACGFLYKPMNS